MKPANSHPRASVVSNYHGPTNTKGSRISVDSKHSLGRKYYSWDYSLDIAENHQQAVRHYLERIEQINSVAVNGQGWGKLSDFVHGVMNDGRHVFTPAK